MMLISHSSVNVHHHDSTRPAIVLIVQDDVFESKEEIAHTIKDELTKSMTGNKAIMCDMCG